MDAPERKRGDRRRPGRIKGTRDRKSLHRSHGVLGPESPQQRRQRLRIREPMIPADLDQARLRQA
ncbi:MAG: hypothetical protein RLZZ21_2044 [Planctomycetota bacterium]|jgi:hypothetical protein